MRCLLRIIAAQTQARSCGGDQEKQVTSDSGETSWALSSHLKVVLNCVHLRDWYSTNQKYASQRGLPSIMSSSQKHKQLEVHIGPPGIRMGLHRGGLVLWLTQVSTSLRGVLWLPCCSTCPPPFYL